MSDKERSGALLLENQLCFPLYAAARQVVGLYTPYLKRLGLTYTQYIVFLVLWQEDDITVGELGRRLYLDNGTLTPLLKKLESSGYIIRTRDKSDERIVRITLTDSGRELKHQAEDIPFGVGSCIPLDRDDAAVLYKLLNKLIKEEE